MTGRFVADALAGGQVGDGALDDAVPASPTATAASARVLLGRSCPAPPSCRRPSDPQPSRISVASPGSASRRRRRCRIRQPSGDPPSRHQAGEPAPGHHGNVWVTDFGLAKTGDGGDLTHTGDILGTIRYMAPERFRGQCDVRADVYALGMTLYELLALKPAYEAGDRLKLIDLIRHTEAASPRTVDARIPRDLETIVMKAIDKDPKRRYQSADELGEDLQRFVSDEPVKARRIGSVERLVRWCRRNPAVAGLTAAVLALMAGGTAVSTWQAVMATRARADLAVKNAALAEEQAKVQARFDLAQKAIALFHTGVSEDMLLQERRVQRAADEALEGGRRRSTPIWRSCWPGKPTRGRGRRWRRRISSSAS